MWGHERTGRQVTLSGHESDMAAGTPVRFFGRRASAAFVSTSNPASARAPVATRRRIDAAKRSKENLGPNPFGYKRAFAYTPTTDDLEWIGRRAGSASPALPGTPFTID